MVIYLDILIVLNIFVDYFLLRGCGILLKINIKKRRLIFGALIGSLFSIFIIFPSLNIFLNLFIKIVSAVVLILITFGYKERQLFIKTFFIFFAENLIFVGVMFFLWIFISPPGMYLKNGVTYIAISPLILVVGSVAAYVFTYIINFAISRRIDEKKIYSIEIEFDKRSVILKALYDSGNCLVEPFSGKPVCICEYEKLLNILPKELVGFFGDFFSGVKDIGDSKFKKFVKLVPSSTVTGFAILPAFLPESFYVFKDENEKLIFDCYVAVTTKKLSDGEYSSIIGDFS